MSWMILSFSPVSVPSLGRRQFHVVDVAAAVGDDHDAFPARLDPLDRLLQLNSRETRQSFFGPDVALAAEASADFRSNDPHVMLGEIQLQGQLRLEQVRNLRGRVDRQLFGAGVILGHHAARLDRRRRQAGNNDAFLDHDVGLGEGFVDIPAV